MVNHKETRITLVASLWCFIVNFQYITHFVLVFIVDFEQFVAYWTWKAIVSDNIFTFSFCKKHIVLMGSGKHLMSFQLLIPFFIAKTKSICCFWALWQGKSVSERYHLGYLSNIHHWLQRLLLHFLLIFSSTAAFATIFHIYISMYFVTLFVVFVNVQIHLSNSLFSLKKLNTITLSSVTMYSDLHF